MKSTIGLIACLVLMSIGWALPAHAQEEDIVRSLDVTYDVQADGTIDVTYTLDWDFGTTGRRGIELGIVTSEVWDQDPMKEAVYDITDLNVTSPTGVPTDIQTYENSISGTLDVRVGDPDQTLDVDRAIYEITYTLGGALRTFDGYPQLYWDVTSSDYPVVENFSVTVNAPSEIPRARCLVGSDECDAVVEGTRAVLSGGDAERYQIITVVAEFEPESVANAEPVLRDRELSFPALLEMDSVTTVDSDGVAHVEEHLTVLNGTEYPYIEWRLPTRNRYSWSRDMLFEISDFEVTDGSGDVLPAERTVRSAGSPNEWNTMEVELAAAPGEAVDLIVTYSVAGAVTARDGSTAELAWPISTFEAREPDIPTTETYSWVMPTRISDLDCRFRANVMSRDSRCFIEEELSLDGETVRFEHLADEGSFPNQWIIISVPADAVGAQPAVTELNKTARGWLTALIVIGSLGAAFVLGGWAGRLRFGDARDLRFADVAPGAAGSASLVTARRRSGSIPVRFEPPTASLLETGMALNRRPRQSHLVATLVNMAVAGAVELSAKPLGIKAETFAQCSDSLERSLYRAVDKGSSRYLTNERKTEIQKVFRRAADDAKEHSDLFVAEVKTYSTVIFRTLVSLILPGVAVALSFTDLPIGWTITALAAGLVFTGALFWSARRGVPPLSATGTRIKEQAEGFRLYLRTAEKHQLNFEADQDVFSRYLPWAVLFGDVKRWTKACESLAAAGRIPAPQTHFIVGATSMSQISSELSKISSSVSPSGGGSSSSFGGGSSGSSGFSGGSGGGGGGGGTSAGSW